MHCTCMHTQFIANLHTGVLERFVTVNENIFLKFLQNVEKMTIMEILCMLAHDTMTVLKSRRLLTCVYFKLKINLKFVRVFTQQTANLVCC